MLDAQADPFKAKPPMAYTTRLAQPEDEPTIIAVEIAASALFLTLGLPPLPEPPDHLASETIREGISESRLWVTENAAQQVIGFALAGTMDDNAHLFEIDVLPAYGRQGIGRALINLVEQWAVTQCYDMLTLTTFCAVPWNGPFYRRLGFVDCKPEYMGPALFALFQKEQAENELDWKRCAMAKPLGR